MIEQLSQSGYVSDSEMRARLYAHALEAENFVYADQLADEERRIRRQIDLAWQDRNHSEQDGRQEYRHYSDHMPIEHIDLLPKEVNAGKKINGFKPVPEQYVGFYTGLRIDRILAGVNRIRLTTPDNDNPSETPEAIKV